MELILTEAEKKAATWSELDDATLGKVVKATMFKIEHTSNEQQKLTMFAAALLLCTMAAEANADTLKQTIEGLTVKGKPLGDWKITIKRIPFKKTTNKDI